MNGESAIIPRFKKGEFSLGILEGVRGMEAMARGLQLPKPKPPWWFYPVLIGGAILIVLLVYNLFKSGKKGWAWAVIIAVGVILWFVLRNASAGGGFGGGELKSFPSGFGNSRIPSLARFCFPFLFILHKLTNQSYLFG